MQLLDRSFTCATVKAKFLFTMEKVQVCTLNAYVGIEPIRRRGIYKKAVIVGLSLEASTAERLDVAQARQGWQQGEAEPRSQDTQTERHTKTQRHTNRL